MHVLRQNATFYADFLQGIMQSARGLQGAKVAERYVTQPDENAQAEPAKAADPLAGREVKLLNSLLAALIPEAQSGDAAAIDRVLKILELKRKYAEDAARPPAGWKL
jgi:hypothetical protein